MKADNSAEYFYGCHNCNHAVCSRIAAFAGASLHSITMCASSAAGRSAQDALTQVREVYKLCPNALSSY